MSTPGFAISRSSPEPAYAQLAGRLRHLIADGTYPPGSQIPPELALGREFGLSPMTVRRAIGLLTEEGLLKALQGRGTFVQTIEWQSSGFSLKPLADLIVQDGHTRVKALKVHTIKADATLARRLSVPERTRLIHILRLLVRDGVPLLLQSGHIIYNPRLPLVEAELDIISLSGLFTGNPNTSIKRGELETTPRVLDEEEAGLLRQPAGSAAFSLEYLFWSFQDQPIGYGYFLVPAPFLSLKTKIGLWLTQDHADGNNAATD